MPWLGVNTQHESLAATTGEVTYRLNSVQGPGKVALWSAGAFGTGVGKRLADNVGGPRQFVVPPNTHMHPSWAFTKPGNYRLNFTVSTKTKTGSTVSAPLPLYFKVGNGTAGAAQSGAGATQKVYVGKTSTGADCTLSAAQVATIKASGGTVLAQSTATVGSGSLAKSGVSGLGLMLSFGMALIFAGVGTRFMARKASN